MQDFHLYQDIAERTGGDIYIGVVGPVRTGKSTFIKRFMDLLVLPNIENAHTRDRARDELPQSASGRSIMTTEPKFVPNEAVPITVGDNVELKVRLIDCVGYIVPEAEGYLEGDTPRMVNTPWSEDAMPFLEAAELGTRKVITDHSTIGILVTTDGSVTELDRQNYMDAERRVVQEMQEIGKPFVILLNSSHPFSEETKMLRQEMSESYQAPVLAVNCAQLRTEDIQAILEELLYEFPMKEIRFFFPQWIETLDQEHWLKKQMVNSLKDAMGGIGKLAGLKDCIQGMEDAEHIQRAYIDQVKLGEGAADVTLTVDDSLFYKVLSETIDMPIENDAQLIATIKALSDTKREYDKVQNALEEVNRKGYGVVAPVFEEITLSPPEVFKQGSRYGIRLKAKGESIHMIKADIETEVSPIIGNEDQSREFIDTLLQDYESEPEKIWDLNIFGRTLSGLVGDGMQNKIYRMPEDAQSKLQETLQKIVNEGSGGLICIIL